MTFQVKGFTCITCAIGLEAVLKGFGGVESAKAASVVVSFDAAATSAETLRAFINKTTGFPVSG